jgi:hypothetical protein
MRVAAFLVSFAIVASAAACRSEHVEPPAGAVERTIETSDGAELEGLELGQGDRVVVMSHGATTTMEDFFELAKAFAADGWRAILYDARDIEDRPTDLRGAVAAAREGPVATLVLVGGSIGASVSLALGDELDADAIVALSPPRDAFDALRAARALPEGMPVFVAAAEDDDGFAADAREIATAVGEDPLIVPGHAHATGMLVDHPELIGRIVRWVDESVGD